jgi:hypothetical protein
MVEFAYTAVCEDVRREDSGKLILIGVYGHNINVTEVPANLVLSLVLFLRIKERTAFDFRLKAEFDGRALAEGQGRMELLEEGDGVFVIPNIFLPNIDKSGDINFMIQQGDAEWQTVRSIPFNYRPQT